MIKVRIKKVPKARTGYQVQGALVNDVPAMGGADYNAYIGKPQLEASKYITAVPREEANLEAEGGETVYGDINADGMPEHKIIKGPRHSEGGVPLSLPEDTFIFSDTKAMRIKDPKLLTMFGKGGTTKSYTPAELAKQYDIQKYRKILEDPDTDAIERKTAELMIKKYVVKLGCLALAQESMKGFPQGIPLVAKPCMEARGLTEEDVLPSKDITVLNDQLKKQMEAQQGSDENQLEEAMQMNEGMPVAQPQDMDAMAQEMMRYGGYRKLKRAQEGMAQQGQDEMVQITQQVQDALQRGSEPAEVVMTLLQNGIQPEGVVEIFTQLGASAEEAVGLIQEVMQQGQGAAQDQMTEQPMSEEEMMMQEQQMQQAPPMAMYGISMGGYDMPFYDLPEAEYGMAMGANSNNYQGRSKRVPASSPIFNLAKAQNGIEIKRDDYKTDQDFQNALRRAYVQSGRGKQKIYVIYPDGRKVQQKVSATGHDKYSGTDLDKWNGNAVAAATFEAMTQTFNDPKAKATFANQVRSTLADKEAYKGKSGKYSRTYKDTFGKDPKDLTDDEIVAKYLRMQERNLKTTTYKDKLGVPMFGSWMYKDATGDLRNFDSTGDGKGDRKGFKDVVKEANPNLTDVEIKSMYDKINNSGLKSLQAVSSEIGLPMERQSKSGRAASGFDEEAYIQQAGFIAADRLMKDLDTNPDKYDEDTQISLLGLTSMSGFNPYGKQVGYSDESGMNVSNISPIDAYYTNTTQGQIQAHHGLKFEDILEDETQPANETVKKCPCQKADGSIIEMTADANGNCPPCIEDVDIPMPGQPAPWWLQDTIKTTGAFGDLMGIKKYMPWAPGVELGTPRPTFLDPTRELAANAEQANIQTQGMAQFAGPQALSARSASVQGQAAKNAADILSKYNNANVNLANQFELTGTDIRNKESMLKQATAQRLYDQNTVANQQFDNAKLAMRNNLRNYYTNAITNRWQTDALNQMFPNYAIDPSVGGEMNFVSQMRNPSPDASTGMTMEDAIEWCKQNNPNATDQSACMQRVLSAQGKAAPTTGTDASMIKTMYGKNGGNVFEDGGYVYIDSWLPFIM